MERLRTRADSNNRPDDSKGISVSHLLCDPCADQCRSTPHGDDSSQHPLRVSFHVPTHLFHRSPEVFWERMNHGAEALHPTIRTNATNNPMKVPARVRTEDLIIKYLPSSRVVFPRERQGACLDLPGTWEMRLGRETPAAEKYSRRILDTDGIGLSSEKRPCSDRELRSPCPWTILMPKHPSFATITISGLPPS